MNNEIVNGIVRHGLTLLGGYLVSRGHLDVGDVQTVVGALSGLFGVAWSVYSKKQAA